MVIKHRQRVKLRKAVLTNKQTNKQGSEAKIQETMKPVRMLRNAQKHTKLLSE